MGLITKTIIVKWRKDNKEWYESKGYNFTNYGNEFEIKVEDLTNGSHITVDIKCDNPDCKNPYLKPMKWQDYKKCVHEDGKYYCNKCAKKLYGDDKMMKTRLKKSISFEQWCVNTLSEEKVNEILSRWDYEKNIDKDGKVIKPSEVLYSSQGINKKGYWFKCNKNLKHKSELKSIKSLTTGKQNTIDCHQCNSFEQWCYDNLDIDYANEILSRWDYGKNVDKDGNVIKPNEINHSSGGINYKGYWFKCLRHPEHKSELKRISDFINGNDGVMKCKQCNSFAQYLIDTYGENALEKYWDYDKNNKINVDPWKISKASDSIKIWLFCQEDKIHGSYNVVCGNFSKNNGTRCPICNKSKGERKVEDYLKIQNINYIPQQEFDGLIGLKGGNLSYDFYLPNPYNLLIEYQGEQHEKPIDFIKNGMKKAEEKFKQQQEHDRRKKQYAIDNKINLLEIWYWNFDNIEDILEKELIVN